MHTQYLYSFDTMRKYKLELNYSIILKADFFHLIPVRGAQPSVTDAHFLPLL